jgi:hypothetical protein
MDQQTQDQPELPATATASEYWSREAAAWPQSGRLHVLEEKALFSVPGPAGVGKTVTSHWQWHPVPVVTTVEEDSSPLFSSERGRA